MTAELREQTPPPRHRGGHSASSVDRAVQQHVWSVKPGDNDLTSSPVSRPKDILGIISTKEEGLLSPQPTKERDCLLPLKVNEDTCFSSPKPYRGPSNEVNLEAELFESPTVGSGGKENLLPAQGPTPRTPLKTPSRLPTVQEHNGHMPPLDEHETMPAWVVRSPEPATVGDWMKERGLSPTPPGLEDIFSELPKHTVKGTFIQFVSPLKTFSVMSPPKTEPVNFAPSAASAQLFSLDAPSPGLAMSHSPSPWFTHDEVPFFPASKAPPVSSLLTQQAPPAGSEAQNKGPVVRLADFLPGPPSAGPPPCDQGFASHDQGYSFNMMPPMQSSELGSALAPSLEGHASSGFSMQGPNQQWPQMQQRPTENMQDPASLQHEMQMMQMLQQMNQLPQMQPPQMQAPQMQPPQMQPPQLPQHLHMPPQQMQPEPNLFLQQLMQMQMQPQMQPPPWQMAAEQVQLPAPQGPMQVAAPSVLCPSTCHQAQVCRCGEFKLGDSAAMTANNGVPDSQQVSRPTLTLSAAMFPEMGNN